MIKVTNLEMGVLHWNLLVHPIWSHKLLKAKREAEECIKEVRQKERFEAWEKLTHSHLLWKVGGLRQKKKNAGDLWKLELVLSWQPATKQRSHYYSFMIIPIIRMIKEKNHPLKPPEWNAALTASWF